MKKKPTSWRLLSLVALFILLFSAILARLFYWQVVDNERLLILAKNQYYSQKAILASRGEIFANDEFPLVSNQRAYLLYASLSELEESKEKISASLSRLLVDEEEIEASGAGRIKALEAKIKEKEKEFKTKLGLADLEWVILEHKLPEEVKRKTEELGFKGLGFEEEQERFYPEASMAAHLLGFLGKNEAGQDTGYFGLEGFYDIELKGRSGLVTQEASIAKEPILIGGFSSEEKRDGQSLILHLDRSVQFIVEEELKKAIERHKAKSGSVVAMDPQSGGIIALANYPSFDPKKYFKYEKNLFKNPVISDAYEPGSTFKIFVMAAALDSEAVKPETKCDICDGPLKIDKYVIKTWDDKYHPDSDMYEVIQHSDNLGMVFVSRQLDLDTFWNYLRDFGFGEETNIDLQGEIPCPLRSKNKWSEVDMATAAFGQGISVSAIQLVRAAGAIANQGKLMEPHVVKEIISAGERIMIKPKLARQVIEPKTATIIKEMMVQATAKGETKFLNIPGYKIAGKTGTAEIPVAGHYDTEKTIASFIGFAPADNPKFVMLVKLREPESSPWGSETAAPLFFSIAKRLLLYYGIQPL